MAANGQDVSAVVKALTALLAALSPAQIERLIAGQMQVDDDTANSAGNAVRTPSEAGNAVGGVVKPAELIMKTSGQASMGKVDKKKRSLNSFMAFRSYYAKVFPEIPQKSKSGFLKVLWENDPFKAKWALIAKAYSSIRDDNPGQVRLDTYMSVADQFVGVIAPEQYLAAMNWNVGGSGSGEMSLQRGNVANAGFDMSLLTTDKSALDIVHHCYQVGYVKAADNMGDGSATAQSLVPALAFAVQPAPAEEANTQLYGDHEQMTVTSAPVGPALATTTAQGNVNNNGTHNQINNPTGYVMDEDGDMDFTFDVNCDDNMTALNDHNQQDLDETDQWLKTTLQQFLNPENSNEIALQVELPNGNEVTHLSPHDQLAMENERIALEEADFQDLFLPGGDSLLPYDPYTAQDMFDPFDITTPI